MTFSAADKASSGSILSLRLSFAYPNAYPTDAECADIDRLSPPAFIENTREAGRALASGARGRKFESCRAYHNPLQILAFGLRYSF